LDSPKRNTDVQNGTDSLASDLVRSVWVFGGAFRIETVALKMTNSEVDGTSVVALDGRIVLGEESKSLREKLKGLIAEGKKQIVLNMDNVTYIDSTGLGTLVAAHVSAKTQGASLKLCNLGRRFQELLQLTKLLTVFEVCNTEAAAVASFSH